MPRPKIAGAIAAIGRPDAQPLSIDSFNLCQRICDRLSHRGTFVETSIMAFLVHISEMLGTDPLSLVVLGTLSAVCAFYMKQLSAHTWLAFLYFPVLLTGALAADDVAVALGLYPPLSPSPSFVADGLSNVLVAGVIGMTVAGLALIGGLRRFQ
jgi:hypothetical protein